MSTTSGAARITVAIASLGRPDAVATALASLARQTRRPDRIILSVTKPADLPADLARDDVEIVMGAAGLPRQRNRAVDLAVRGAGLLVFIDDDFVPSRFFLERAEQLFTSHPDIVGATGLMLDDGIKTAGISFDRALELVEEHDAGPCPPIGVERELFGLYGCNMVLRISAIGDRRFDERLRLYGWQEDIDFSAQLRGSGRLVRTRAFAGVHQGVKHGRSPGLKVGYSQVINPLYLSRKGTMRFHHALRLIAKNVISNHIGTLRPEPWVDRAGRTRGNWIGFADLLRGRLEPERIEKI